MRKVDPIVKKGCINCVKVLYTSISKVEKVLSLSPKTRQNCVKTLLSALSHVCIKIKGAKRRPMWAARARLSSEKTWTKFFPHPLRKKGEAPPHVGGACTPVFWENVNKVFSPPPPQKGRSVAPCGRRVHALQISNASSMRNSYEFSAKNWSKIGFVAPMGGA